MAAELRLGAKIHTFCYFFLIHIILEVTDYQQGDASTYLGLCLATRSKCPDEA